LAAHGKTMIKGLSKSLSPFLPSPSGASVFLLVLIYLLCKGPYILLRDGGTCRHLINGLYWLEHFSVPTNNYASAFFSQVPCITNSLIGDIAFSLSYKFWQLNGLVLICAATLALAYMWSYQFARTRGLNIVLSLLTLVPVIFASSLQWTARCHIFSYLFMLVLYYLQFIENSSGPKKTLLTLSLMALWINVHASTFVGVLLLICKTGGTIIETILGKLKFENSPVLRRDLITLFTTPLVLCLNLRGTGIYSYIFGYLLHPMVQAHAAEWQPIDFAYGSYVWPFLLLFVVLAALWTYSRQKPKPGEFLLLSVLFLLGVHSMRIIPYFAFLVLPAAGYCLKRRNEAPSIIENGLESTAMEATLVETGANKTETQKTESQKKETQEPPFVGTEAEQPTLQPGVETTNGSAGSEISNSEQAVRNATPARSGQLAIILQSTAALIAATCFLCLPQFKVKDFNSQALPVEAVSFLENQKLNGLGFVWDNWGGYLYWRLHRPVFIDDWTDYYPPEFTMQYVAVVKTYPGWDKILNSYHFQYLLVPKGPTALGIALSQSPDWQIVFSDEASNLYVPRY
jgi:hypothetical protein